MKELFNKYDWENWNLLYKNSSEKYYEEEREFWADTLSYLFLFSRKMVFNIKSQIRKNEEELVKNIDISKDYLTAMEFYITTLTEEKDKVDSAMERILDTAGFSFTSIMCYFLEDIHEVVQIAHNRIQTMGWHK
jgi:hypothetical protein